MPARSPQHGEVERFSSPEGVNHRRYEALRAFFVERLSYKEAGRRFGYSRWAMVDLVRQFRAGQALAFLALRARRDGPVVSPATRRERTPCGRG